MAIETLGAVLGQLRRLFADGVVAGLSDAQLLERFLGQGDVGAFDALLARHGPMVLSVCRGVLRDPRDAEDAFQASFLVLVKKGGTIRGRDALAGWLYQVAYRVAIQANTAEVTRRRHESEAGRMAIVNSTNGEVASDDLLPALHAEIARLPEKYRLAIVLCDLEGMTQVQAAEQLRCSERTVRQRLAEGRARLKRRLARRGLAAEDVALGAVFLREARTAVPYAWQESTVCAVVDAVNHCAGAGAVSTAAYRLARGVLEIMLIQKLKLAMAGFLFVALMAWGAWAALSSRGDEPPKARATPGALVAQTASPLPPKPDLKPDWPDAVGTFTIRGQVLDPDGKPVANAEIFVRHHNEYGWSPISPVSKGQKGRVAVSNTDGRFQFELDKASSDFPYGEQTSWHKAMIAATALGFGLAWVEAGSLANGGEARLRLVRDDVPIRGRVLDTQGRPVAGVTVRLGRITEVKSGVDLDVLLASGKIDDSQISASYGNDDVVWPGGKNTWTTDGDGRFEVKGIGRNRISLLYFHSHSLADESLYVMSRAVNTPRLSGPQPIGAASDVMADLLVRARSAVPRVVGPTFELVAGPTKPITGVVRLKGTGKPLVGVIVHGAVSATRAAASTRTDAEGRFRLVGLPKGAVYQIRAFPRTGIDPFLGKTITVTDTAGVNPIETTLELVKGVIVVGRLVDEATGQPVFAGISQYFKLPTNRNEGGSTQKDGGERAGHLSLTDPTFRLTVPPGEGVFCSSPRAGKRLSPPPA